MTSGCSDKKLTFPRSSAFRHLASLEYFTISDYGAFNFFPMKHMPQTIFMAHRRSYIVPDSNKSISISFRICCFLTIVSPVRMVLGLIKIDGRTRCNNIFHFTSWTFHAVINGFERDQPPHGNAKCALYCCFRYGMLPFVIYFRFFLCAVFSVFSLAIWFVRKVWRNVCTRIDRYGSMHNKIDSVA